MQISFIGFGNMAKAMAKGLLQDVNITLSAAAPSLSSGLNQEGIKTYSNNLSVVADANVIILAVKPWQIATVFHEIRSSLSPDCLIISIATGIPLTWFSTQSPGTAIIRAMPNIGAAISESATPLIANDAVNQQQQQWAEMIFGRIGIVTWVHQEADMDAFTAFSGSGPAYVCLFIEAMINAAERLGIPKEVAHDFALQTVNGTLNILKQGEFDPQALRQQVTSPAGTTAAAIEIFKAQGFEALIHAAMTAAYRRAQELGRSTIDTKE
jgi:pyrroline-5-carboxylate reductase